MPGINTIQELQKRFKPEAARNVTATYLFAVRGQDGSMVLTKINDGQVEFEDVSNESDPNGKADCVISVSSDDLADSRRQHVGNDCGSFRCTGDRRRIGTGHAIGPDILRRSSIDVVCPVR